MLPVDLEKESCANFTNTLTSSNYQFLFIFQNPWILAKSLLFLLVIVQNFTKLRRQSKVFKPHLRMFTISVYEIEISLYGMKSSNEFAGQINFRQHEDKT